MDYTGTTTGMIINTINTLPTPQATSHLLEIIQQFIPAELLGMVDRPLTLIVFLWILIILWVLKDSNYRSSSTGFCLFSLLLVTVGTPLIGLPIYLAIRPLGYKYEREYRKWVMTEMEDEQEYYEEIAEEESEEDAEHLAQLQAQAKKAQQRLTTKSTSSKPTKKKIPVAKKATTRGSK